MDRTKEGAPNDHPGRADMTAVTIDRAVVENLLEVMRGAVPTGKITLYAWYKALSDLDAALAQRKAESQSVAQRFNEAFSRHAATRGDAVLIERRDGRLYMNGAEIGPGTLEIREDGVTYRSATLVDVRKPEQAEPVAIVVSASDFEGRVQWRRAGRQPKLNTPLYAAASTQTEGGR